MNKCLFCECDMPVLMHDVCGFCKFTIAKSQQIYAHKLACNPCTQRMITTQHMIRTLDAFDIINKKPANINQPVSWSIINRIMSV